MNIIIFGVIILLIFAPITIGLQVLLSTRKNMWYGLCMPILFALIGIIIYPTKICIWKFVFQDYIALILCLIPSIVTLLVYFICRNAKKMKPGPKGNDGIDKMKIQDL